jgi:CheY-like chemotaxis protein
MFGWACAAWAMLYSGCHRFREAPARRFFLNETKVGTYPFVSLPVILCIDDEALGLEIRRTVLEHAGYQVLTAVDGAAGLSLFRTRPVQGVVLDYYMPGMDGGEVAEAMRRERPEIPIMLLSAYINLPPEVISLVDVTLLKGEGPVELLDKLRAMLRNGGDAQ